MTHFAKIDSTNTVTEVIVAEQDFINSGKVGDSFDWQAPTAMPDDDKMYIWNENTTTWDLINDGWKE